MRGSQVEFLVLVFQMLAQLADWAARCACCDTAIYCLCSILQLILAERTSYIAGQ